MERTYRRIVVAAKNTDTLEHDIADSDDYFQYHGGMVATVRALTGADPKAYVGDSTTPDAVRTRTLQEETNRVFRARVVNPRWIGAMQRHGYKGAFELAASAGSWPVGRAGEDPRPRRGDGTAARDAGGGRGPALGRLRGRCPEERLGPVARGPAGDLPAARRRPGGRSTGPRA